MTELEKAKAKLFELEQQIHKDIASQEAAVILAYTVVDMADSIHKIAQSLYDIKEEMRLQSVGGRK